MTPEEYKLLQEASITGHTGGSAWEVSLLTVQCFTKLNVVAEALLLIVPAVLSLCRPDWMPYILFCQSIILLSRKPIKTSKIKTNKKPFITAFKSTVMLLTIICILAVDFRVFPRRFAKTEVTGWSVMDAGVGATVVGMGVSRGLSSAKTVVWRRALPVAVIGVLRTAAVKLSDYQEHVSEYGVHWNFFLTLSAVILFGHALTEAMGVGKAGWTGMALLCVYEVLLNKFDWFRLLTNSNRDTILMKNKEGVASLFGYVAVYLVSTRIGHGVRTADHRKLPLHLLVTSLILYLISSLLTEMFDLQPSRRLANAAYCLLVLALCTGHLAAFAFIDNHGYCRSTLLDKVNKRQLAVFLWANVLTGVVNKVVYTLLVGDAVAMTILFIYAALVTGFALY